MNIGITGYNGFIGSELVKKGGIPLKCDITNPSTISKAIAEVRPDVIIHCAAHTDVDYLETHFSDGFDVNVKGTSNLIDAISRETFFIYISSDHVFSGDKYWVEGYNENNNPNPVNRYGFSKWGGELALFGHSNSLIVRSSKLYNYAWLKPTIDRLMNNETVEFTNIIKRSFMYLPHFVDALLWLSENRINKNVIHISGESVFSYYVFWSIVQKSLELPGIVVPRNHELKEACPRPLRAGLDIRRAKRLGIPLGSMSDALAKIKEQLNEQ